VPAPLQETMYNLKKKNAEAQRLARPVVCGSQDGEQSVDEQVAESRGAPMGASWRTVRPICQMKSVSAFRTSAPTAKGDAEDTTPARGKAGVAFQARRAGARPGTILMQARNSRSHKFCFRSKSACEMASGLIRQAVKRNGPSSGVQAEAVALCALGNFEAHATSQRVFVA
jgi:hypothetical protein